MRNALPILSLLLMPFLLTACSSTPTATMDFDPGFDFTGVRKIAIKPIDRTISSTAAISDIQVNRMNQTLSEELDRRGFQVVADKDQADLLLAWHLVTQERTDIRSYNSSIRYTNCWNCRPSTPDIRVRNYTQGTFIADMVDPEAGQSVWRSIFESRLRDQPDPQRAEENRREAAQAVFKEFPPK
jgi:hypothetical protein